MAVEEKDQKTLLIAELEWVKAELVDYRVKEKKAFLESQKFFDLLGSCFAALIDYDFERDV